MVWATKWWPHRVFAFLLAITEVNVMLASVYFGGYPKTSMVNFRQQLAQALIGNTYVPLNDGRDPRRSPRNELEPTHKLCALPRGKKILNGQVVDSNMDYSQRKCSGCKRKVRTYCKCSVGVTRCDECFAGHVFYAESTQNNQDWIQSQQKTDF